MRRDEAIALLKRRIRARQTNDTATVNKVDRIISKAVTRNSWPEIRTDSDNAPKNRGDNRRPISKAPEPEHLYAKAPPRKDWEA